MYLEHFGLREAPFRITPHPEFFFDGADRGTTLEALSYAILHDEGIVKVSGEIGSGKTMLCRVLMERSPPEVATVFLANPSYSRAEIVQAIGEELGSRTEPGALALRALLAHLIEMYASGRRVVLLVDEAHAMPEETLEQIRLLSNLESRRHKLLQIVLFGQPELDATLAKPSMRQLKDRITHAFRMRPLTGDEVGHYLSFRMRAAGYRGPEVFSPAAVARIARASSGLTRRINLLADKSLLAAFAANTHAITPRQVRAAVADTEFAALARPPRRAAYATAGAALLAVGALAGAGLNGFLQEREAEPPARPALVRAPTPSVAAPVAPVSARVDPPAPAGADPLPAPASAGPASTPTAAASEAAPAPAASEAAPAASAPLTRAQFRRFSGYAPGSHPLLRARIAATREKLQSEPGERYSIELFTTENSDSARMERFLTRARDMVPLVDLYVVPLAVGPGYRMLVAYGSFADREAAAEAVRRLPPKYQQAFSAEPRSFAALRSAI